MQGNQVRTLEAELWRAADQLRANCKFTASEYSIPVLGLIFLRHSFNRFTKVKVEVEKSLPTHPQRGKRALTKKILKSRTQYFYQTKPNLTTRYHYPKVQILMKQSTTP